MHCEVPRKSIEATTRCRRNMACITGCCDQPLCPVEHANGMNVTFLAQPGNPTCPYYTLFAARPTCTCPVRYEIARRYGI